MNKQDKKVVYIPDFVKKYIDERHYMGGMFLLTPFMELNNIYKYPTEHPEMHDWLFPQTEVDGGRKYEHIKRDLRTSQMRQLILTQALFSQIDVAVEDTDADVDTSQDVKGG